MSLPTGTTCPAAGSERLVKRGRKTRRTSRSGCSPQRACNIIPAGNAGIALMDEVSENLHGHTGVMLNADTAAKLGIAEGDRVEVRSHIGAPTGALP